MNKIVFSVFLITLFVFGCQDRVDSVIPPAPIQIDTNPIPLPDSVNEQHNGKSFLVKKSSVITFALSVNVDEDYFWAFSSLSGDFEVLSDSRKGAIQTLKVKVNSSGNVGLQYCHFTPEGVKIISRLSFGVVDS